MNLKVILDATPKRMEELTIKHVKRRVCVIIYAFQSGGTIRDVSHLGR